jgi:hypothetical protein
MYSPIPAARESLWAPATKSMWRHYPVGGHVHAGPDRASCSRLSATFADWRTIPLQTMPTARRMRDRFADYVHSKRAVPSVQCMLYRLRVRRVWPDRKTKQHRCVSLDRRQCATGSAGRQVTLDAAPSRRSPGSSVPPVLVPLNVGGYGVSRLKYWLALFGAKACPNMAVASSPALSSPM